MIKREAIWFLFFYENEIENLVVKANELIKQTKGIQEYDFLNYNRKIASDILAY